DWAMGVFGLFDPPECKQAEDCLARSQPAEAARVLLASKHRRHRRVQQLLLETGARLVELAQNLVENPQGPHPEAAAEMIDLASQCMHLDGPALALQQQIQQILHDRQQSNAFRAQLLRQAEQWEQSGRLRSALEVLEPLGEWPEAAALRLRLQQRLDSFRRHREAMETCWNQGQFQAAHRHWQEAKKLCPHEPELAEWAARIAQALAQPPGRRPPEADALSPVASAVPRPCTALPIYQRIQSFLLADWALVLNSGEACLGAPRSEGVQIPLLGRLHRRHALLVQDGQGWQLMPLADKQGTPCSVWLNGVLLLGPERLRPGDKIVLGGAGSAPGSSGGSCWQFTMPVPGSRTAVLESSP
ncbi:MAG TPA: FHA domain-containing protein, partial [Thermoguttaceae bacterium]|nr:FHA domain-containing protein [Thermoguttaceae bacterium]